MTSVDTARQSDHDERSLRDALVIPMVVGVSHATASLDSVSECTAPAKLLLESARRREAPRVQALTCELALLATCHRVEFYATCRTGDITHLTQLIREMVFHQPNSQAPQDGVYLKAGREAVLHLLRVASGLESVVLGEHEIAGQVRHALHRLVRGEHPGNLLTRMARAARRARAAVEKETSLYRHAVSIPSVAVAMALGSAPRPEFCTVALIGAGQLATRLAQVLRSRVSGMTIINRSRAHAKQLACSVRASTADWADMVTVLAASDVAITATAAPIPIVDAAMVLRAMSLRARGKPPLQLVDLCAPPNIATTVQDVGGPKVITLRDVTESIERSRLLRRVESDEASRILEHEASQFHGHQMQRISQRCRPAAPSCLQS